jgi:L-ascorbate metabolism protein UlaG (beta-lactamase superfamily)
VICGKGLTRNIDGATLVVDPRGKGLTSWLPFDNLHALDVGESINLDGVQIDTVKTVHGPIDIPILGFTFKAQPGAGERVGIGSTGFRITIGDTSVLNLGDTVLLPEWKDVSAEVLMLPIGGLGQNTWTMDVDEALEAVKLISTKWVIPCHYKRSVVLEAAVCRGRRSTIQARGGARGCRVHDSKIRRVDDDLTSRLAESVGLATPIAGDNQCRHDSFPHEPMRSTA